VAASNIHEVAVAVVGPVADGQAVEAEAGVEVAGAEVNGPPKNLGLMGRKFWSGFPKKQAVVFTKFPRKKRSIRSTPALPKNCSRSTAWAIHPAKMVLQPAITRLSWRPRTRT